MINFKQYITEGQNLGAPELKKNNSTTKEPRIDILADLITAKTPLETTKGALVTVVDIDDALSKIEMFKTDGKNFSLITDRGLVKTTELKKSKVFGGGTGGAGGGTDQTRVTESAQCLWCAAIVQLGHTTPIEKVTENDLKAASKNIFVDAKFEEMMNVSDAWKQSAYLSAVELAKAGYITKNMTFHRGDSVMKRIYALKDSAYKMSGLPKMKDDKWNPGDIWAIDRSFNFKELDATSIKALQVTLLNAFVDRKCVGISLKLVKKVAKIKYYNISLPPEQVDYKIQSLGAKSLRSGRGSFWTTKSGEIITTDNMIIQIRDNSAFGALKAEILGKTARGGGAGWEYVALVMQQIYRAKLPNTREIAVIARKAISGDAKALETVYNTFNAVEPMTRQEFDTGILNLKGDGAWLHSKYGVCSVLQYLVKDPAKANRAITKIINYAQSTSEDSSAYIKVYS